MFKKRKQNIRQRRRNEDSDDENEGEEKQEETTTVPGVTQIWDQKVESVSSKSKESKKEGPSSSKSGVLSFADEEEAESEFKIKKSSRSERIARKLKKASRKEKEAEAAAQKKKEEDERKNIYDYKPQSPVSDVGRGSDFDSDPEESGGHAFRSVLDTGRIPDANMIHMARKRRQMARDAQDYIPITETKRSVHKEKSRLVREEINDDQSDEEVVPFSKHVHDRERQRMRDEFLEAEHGSGDSDEEKDRWEAQQLKKAMNVPAVQPTAGEKHLMDTYLPSVTKTQTKESKLYLYESVPQSALSVPQSMIITPAQAGDVNTDQLCKRLRECLDNMKSVHSAHQAEYTKCKDDLEENKNMVEHCETSVSVLDKRYKFFQHMKGYIKDLVLCHNEKLPIIESLENRYLQLLKDRAALILKRRQQDIKDQVTDYNPFKKQPTSAPPMDAPRQRRGAEREARKGRRRRARESINIVGHYDGLSTDDEQTQSDLTRADLERQKIQAEKDVIYEDVLEEFCKIPKVIEQFEEWKFDHSESYKDAYIALCLPKIFSPLVRLELVDWNPLDPACSSLERQKWFMHLAQYGRAAEIDPEDLDLKIAPSIIEKYIVPKLTILAETVWDPLSKRETLLFVSLVEKIATDYPLSDESKNMQLLLKAIVDRINKCVDDDIFLPLYPKHVFDNKFSLAAVFFSRQVWTCIKMFRNTLTWHRVLSPAVLKQIACESLFNRYILLGLSNCLNNQLIQRCQMIADAIPSPWFEEASEDSTIPELDSFCRFLVNVALNLDRLNGTLKNELDALENRTTIQTIQKLLVGMHAMDMAMDLMQNCSTKIDR